MSNVKRSEVDGTVPGVAVAVIVRMDDPDKPLVSVDRYAEPDFPDPQGTAEGLWESIKGDWPGCQQTVTLNERARYLMTRRRMAQMGLGEYTVEQYVTTR